MTALCAEQVEKVIVRLCSMGTDIKTQRQRVKTVQRQSIPDARKAFQRGFCAAEMAGELIINLSENLPIKRACPRLWCRAACPRFGVEPKNCPPQGLARGIGVA